MNISRVLINRESLRKRNYFGKELVKPNSVLRISENVFVTIMGNIVTRIKKNAMKKISELVHNTHEVTIFIILLKLLFFF